MAADLTAARTVWELTESTDLKGMFSLGRTLFFSPFLCAKISISSGKPSIQNILNEHAINNIFLLYLGYRKNNFPGIMTDK